MQGKEIFVTSPSMPPFEEYHEMIRNIWETKWLTNMGKYHNQFQNKLEEYLGMPYVSLFTNGHMALELALQAFDLKGEVITTPFTFASTTHAIVRNGLTPVFCDINMKDYTIDVSQIERCITPATCAIVPVHVYGNLCDVEEIERIAQKHQIKVIYDAAHAFGETYKGKSVACYGDAAMFSFHATKVFNTIEGGAVAHNSEWLQKKLYNLKNFGIKDEECIDEIGANAKMNEFQAAMGICNMKYLEENIQKRKVIADRYREILEGNKGIKLLSIQDHVKSNYAYFPIMIEEKGFGLTRNELYAKLKREGIHTRKYFYPIVNEYNCYKEQYSETETPIAKYVSERILTLPLYADLDLETVERICQIILKD